MYEIILIAIGVFGLAWLFASSRESTARKLWKPGDTALMVGRLIIGGLTVYVLLSAGGIAFFIGVLAAFFGGLHLYFTRPDRDVPQWGPIGWLTSLPTRMKRALVGGR